MANVTVNSKTVEVVEDVTLTLSKQEAIALRSLLGLISCSNDNEHLFTIFDQLYSAGIPHIRTLDQEFRIDCEHYARKHIEEAANSWVIE